MKLSFDSWELQPSSDLTMLQLSPNMEVGHDEFSAFLRIKGALFAKDLYPIS